jgi:hypothetical protein
MLHSNAIAILPWSLGDTGAGRDRGRCAQYRDEASSRVVDSGVALQLPNRLIPIDAEQFWADTLRQDVPNTSVGIKMRETVPHVDALQGDPCHP